MNKANLKKIYLNMIAGMVGIILIFVGMVEFITHGLQSKGGILLGFGLLLTVQYLYYLEGKVGINKKLIMIRGLTMAITLYAVVYFFY